MSFIIKVIEPVFASQEQCVAIMLERRDDLAGKLPPRNNGLEAVVFPDTDEISVNQL